MKITFLLPEDNRSGGVRVTSIMASMLKDCGHIVRIVCTRKQGFIERIQGIYKRPRKSTDIGWLHQFTGEVIYEADINRLSYEDTEVVVGVGTYTLENLITLKKKVRKLRYNHGLPAVMDNRSRKLWSYPLPTITVSRTLVPLLEEMCPNCVIGVVPNGIDQTQYYDMELIRSGIGVFYSSHPNKAPDFIVALLQRIHSNKEQIPIYVVSGERCPAELTFASYYNYPSVDKVRELYNNCKVWLLPSDTEGLPGPVLEAMSCGTVVVSTDNEGSLEIIKNQVNGLVSPRRNMDMFVDNVFKVYADGALFSQLSSAGKITASEFTWSRSLDAMQKVLLKIQSIE